MEKDFTVKHFTLIELMVSIVILAIISVVVVCAFSGASRLISGVSKEVKTANRMSYIQDKIGWAYRRSFYEQVGDYSGGFSGLGHLVRCNHKGRVYRIRFKNIYDSEGKCKILASWTNIFTGEVTNYTIGYGKVISVKYMDGSGTISAPTSTPYIVIVEISVDNEPHKFSIKIK